MDYGIHQAIPGAAILALYYLLAILIRCSYGEMVSTKAAKVCDAVFYSIERYEPKNRRLLVIIIQHMQQPLYLTGLGLNAWECSMDNFRNVIPLISHRRPHLIDEILSLQISAEPIHLLDAGFSSIIHLSCAGAVFARLIFGFRFGVAINFNLCR